MADFNDAQSTSGGGAGKLVRWRDETDGTVTEPKTANLRAWNATDGEWQRVLIDDATGGIITTGGGGPGGSSDTELPTALALTDNMAVPTAPAVASHVMLFDGSTYDRARGDSTDGLLVNLGANNDVTVTGTVTANAGTGPWPVTDNGGSLTVDGTITANLAAGTNNIGDVDVLTVPAPLSTTGGGVESSALRVTIASDSTGILSVDDNGGSLTVDGTVTANAGSGPWPVTDNSGSLTVDAPVATPVFVRLSDGAAAISALPVTDNAGSLTVDDGAGSITVDSAQLPLALVGGRLDVNVGAALPTGSNAIGKLAANDAVDIGDVTVNNAAGASAVNIQDGGNSITVDGTVTANLAAGTNNIGDIDVLTVPAPLSTTGGGTEATALRVTVATDSTGVLSVDDNGGSLTVDGTVTANAATGGGKTLQFASFSQGAAGTTQIVAAQGGSLKVKVVSYVFTLSAAGSAKFTGSSDLTGAFDLAANSGISAVGSVDSHLLETAGNAALSIVTTGGAAKGHISYFAEA